MGNLKHGSKCRFALAESTVHTYCAMSEPWHCAPLGHNLTALECTYNCWNFQRIVMVNLSPSHSHSHITRSQNRNTICP